MQTVLTLLEVRQLDQLPEQLRALPAVQTLSKLLELLADAGEKPTLHPDAGAEETYAHMMTLPKAERSRIHYMPPGPNRWKERSKTFTGLAEAMAQQWGQLAEEAAA